MKLGLDKKLKKEFWKGNKVSIDLKSVIKDIFKSESVNIEESVTPWKYAFSFPLLLGIFLLVTWSLISIQVFSFDKFNQRSAQNQFEIQEIKANRGLILDRNGKKLAQNIPAVSVYIDTIKFVNKDLTLNESALQEICLKITKATGIQKVGNVSLFEKVKAIWNKYTYDEKGWVQKVEVISGQSNNISLILKAGGTSIDGVSVSDGSKREYPFGESFSHILGYTGDVYYEDLADLNYVSFNDVIGKLGLEKVYDLELFGHKGKQALERDSLGNIVQNGSASLTPAISGATLHLSIDAMAQKEMYQVLKRGVQKYGADGGAGILQNVQTGEIIALASYPSFDNNLFVGGISQKDYSKVLKSGKNPLLNRSIQAQVPPGSTFKTIIASAALDAKAIDINTKYTSRRGYTFSDGRVFPEFGNNSYGVLNVVDALTVSSNIFFCETIRNWDMNKLVPYLYKFGIGRYTGIDLIGEGAGRLPSPENKIELARTTSPWLDDVWYPEGDSCNSVIGQGITTVTPIQMVNWVSAIANGGTLNTPRIANILEYPDGTVKSLQTQPIEKNIAGDDALKIVREGMWSSVNGTRRVIAPLSNSKPVIAAKTGTAEFGRINSDGRYEHTHAWVTGFFPYEKPQYSFVVFLEDGGASNNSAVIAREFINWWNANRK